MRYTNMRNTLGQISVTFITKIKMDEAFYTLNKGYRGKCAFFVR